MTVLAAFHILKNKGISKKLLVVSKKRIIYNVWPREVEKWQLDFKCSVVHHANPKKRLEKLKEDADIYLINYEALTWLYSQQPKLYKQFDILVCDESSMVKNWKAQRTDALKKMLPYFDRRIILSGTPTPNSMEDIFAQIYILDMGDALGKFITPFRNRFFNVSKEMTVTQNLPGGKIRKRKIREWELRDGAEREIYHAIKKLVLRIDDKVLKLPPITVMERPVRMSQEARKTYQEVEQDFISWLKSGEVVTVANAGVASQKCRQIANGAVYTGKGNRRKWTEIHDEKVEELADLVEELKGYPLLVAYEFDHDRQRIQKRLPGVPHIGGGVKDWEVDVLVEQWNEGKIPVLLAHPASVAHGLNLQDTPGHVCFFGVDWNLENHEQFIKRVHRQGQKERVFVYMILCEDTVDELVVAALERKDQAQQRLLKALEKMKGEDMKLALNWKKFSYKFTWAERLKLTEILIRHLVDNSDDPRKGDKNLPCYELDDNVAERADFNFVSRICQKVGTWLPPEHDAFQDDVAKVIGKKLIGPNTKDKINYLYAITRAIIFNTLGADQDEELTRDLILIDRKKTLKLWPINLTTTRSNKTMNDETKEKIKRKVKSVNAKKPTVKKSPVKKKVAAKKKTATATSKKPATARRGKLTDADRLLKLLKRKKGCGIEEACERLDLKEPKVRNLISKIRKEGTPINRLGKGVFQASV